MKLRGLIKNLDYVLEGSVDTEIESVQINTKSGGIKNSLFICIKGLKHDTHMDIAEIIGKGALAIACSKDFDTSRYNFNFIKVDNTRYAMSVAAANFYGNTHENMKLIGVTGTNGKTSIVHLINNILFFNNKGTGSVGTLGNLIGNKALDIKYATSTTPDPIELHHIFSEMYKNNASYVVMEATSHALELCKLDNLKFELAVFTNLTQDHLDFHGSFENYLNAKLKLFDISRLAIINIDDGYSGRVINYCKNRVITYGVNNDCDYRAENISYSSNGVSYSIRAKGKVIGHFYIPIPGTFSVYNSLAAIIACLELGLGIGQIENAFLQMPGIPGRMQAVENDLGVRVIVDYSHTPDGLINVLKSAAGFTEGRVITVAGCGGDRDMGKRPIMGKAVFDYSDICIFTSDNPRSEEPDHIIIQMVQGLPIEKGMKKLCRVISDRHEAIKVAVQLAEKGDTVVLAGKGHEAYQEFKNGERVFFDDRAEAMGALAEKKLTAAGAKL